MITPNFLANISSASLDLFERIALDSDNWSGTPLLWDLTSEERGNLSDLKKKGLLTTFRDEGCNWVTFTELGEELKDLFINQPM